jgi:HTH-type transcriptional regulator, competence development regulator
MLFGEYLKKIREDNKLSIRQLAMYSKVSASYLSQIETGERNVPKPEILLKLSKPLKVSYEELMEKAGYLVTEHGIPNKDEMDIAKRMEQIRKDLTSEDGLLFNGEPMSEEAVESLMEAMEHVVRQTQRINKKYIPKKFRNDNDNK